MKAEVCNQIFIEVINQYHLNDDVDSLYKNSFDTSSLEFLLFEKCWIDTVQWHLEDIIRKPDLPPKNGLEIKHRIDISNQNRTDIVEKIDDFYFDVFKNVISKSNSLNTESPGWVVDRMSILCLKIYHMNEQVQRTDVNSKHLENCKNKLHTLNEQQKDLSQAFNELLENYKSGEKKMKVYRQMKMYNDSSLNPELYQKKDS
jgi:hypothetical protein